MRILAPPLCMAMKTPDSVTGGIEESMSGFLKSRAHHTKSLPKGVSVRLEWTPRAFSPEKFRHCCFRSSSFPRASLLAKRRLDYADPIESARCGCHRCAPGFLSHFSRLDFLRRRLRLRRQLLRRWQYFHRH